MATKDPRSLTMPGNAWITDSRAYNLIWLGRWLERASGLVRAIDAAAESSEDDATFAKNCTIVAKGWDVSASELPELLTNCLCMTRDDATHVAPLEIMQKLNALLEDLPEVWSVASDRAATLTAMETLGERLDEISAEVETRWFRRLGE